MNRKVITTIFFTILFIFIAANSYAGDIPHKEIVGTWKAQVVTDEGEKVWNEIQIKNEVMISKYSKNSNMGKILQGAKAEIINSDNNKFTLLKKYRWEDIEKEWLKITEEEFEMKYFIKDETLIFEYENGERTKFEKVKK